MAARGTIEAVDLPFQEAIDFFAQKTNVGTRAWTDVWEAAHARAFMVAGAASDALVGDFRQAIHKAIAEGTTLAEFRKDFDRIVAKHGWTGWTGEGTDAGRAWRTRVIFETNLNMAYAAGRHAQMTDPDVLRVYPYWVYRHSGNPHPRLQHRAWDGLTLAATDPFWVTNYPPNGFNCGCTVEPISARGLARQGKTGPDEAPPLDIQPRAVGRSGRTALAPAGVDPGFAYNPGLAWKGEVAPPHDAVMRASPGFRPPPPAPPAPPIPPIVVTVPPIAAAATDAEMTAAGRAWSRTLSDRETAAIAAYKGDLGKVLNAALRRSQGGVPRLYAPVVEDLDAAIGRSKAPRALTVFRGVKDLAWLRGKVVGDRGELAGYTSTSIRRRVAKTFRGDGLLVIDVPEGYPAAYVHHLAPTGKAQFELLVARGARYEIVEIGDREFRLRILP